VWDGIGDSDGDVPEQPYEVDENPPADEWRTLQFSSAEEGVAEEAPAEYGADESASYTPTVFTYADITSPTGHVQFTTRLASAGVPDEHYYRVAHRLVTYASQNKVSISVSKLWPKPMGKEADTALIVRQLFEEELYFEALSFLNAQSDSASDSMRVSVLEEMRSGKISSVDGTRVLTDDACFDLSDAPFITGSSRSQKFTITKPSEEQLAFIKRKSISLSRYSTSVALLMFKGDFKQVKTLVPVQGRSMVVCNLGDMQWMQFSCPYTDLYARFIAAVKYGLKNQLLPTFKIGNNLGLACDVALSIPGIVAAMLSVAGQIQGPTELMQHKGAVLECLRALRRGTILDLAAFKEGFFACSNSDIGPDRKFRLFSSTVAKIEPVLKKWESILAKQSEKPYVVYAGVDAKSMNRQLTAVFKYCELHELEMIKCDIQAQPAFGVYKVDANLVTSIQSFRDVVLREKPGLVGKKCLIHLDLGTAEVGYTGRTVNASYSLFVSNFCQVFDNALFVTSKFSVFGPLTLNNVTPSSAVILSKLRKVGVQTLPSIVLGRPHGAEGCVGVSPGRSSVSKNATMKPAEYDEIIQSSLSRGKIMPLCVVADNIFECMSDGSNVKSKIADVDYEFDNFDVENDA